MPTRSRVLLAVAAFCALVAVWAVGDLPARSLLLYSFKPAATALLVAVALLGLRAGPSARYAGGVAAGLAASLVGDVLLMLPGDLFLPGLLAFLIVHLCYLTAFTTGVRLAARPLPFMAYGAVGAAVLAALWRSASPRVALVVYGLALCGMAAQAWVRWRVLGTAASRLGAFGAAVFVVSDGLLSIDRFRGPLSGAGVWVLATYYLAQSLIAASTVGALGDAAKGEGGDAMGHGSSF